MERLEQDLLKRIFGEKNVSLSTVPANWSKYQTVGVDEHKWVFCSLCQCNTVICGGCGNNGCNGGKGTINNEPCPRCDDAYEFENHPNNLWLRLSCLL